MRLFLILSLIAAGSLTYVGLKIHGQNAEQSGKDRKIQVAVIGASIASAWDLSRWPARMHVDNIRTESIAAWQFDKSEAIEELLMRPARKFRPTRSYLRGVFFEPTPAPPDVVILKECSAYFPGDPEGYQRQFRNWVRMLRSREVRVIIATVVPVTRRRAALETAKQESLTAFNHWLREFARQENIPVLDLAESLEESSSSSYLKSEWNSGDGSHLNSDAYAMLDLQLQAVLYRITKGNQVVSEQPQ